MFLIGILPALLAVVIRRRLKEPERWEAVAARRRPRSSEPDRFASCSAIRAGGATRWSALLLAAPGVIGLWSLGFFTPELIRDVLDEDVQGRGNAGKTRFPAI